MHLGSEYLFLLSYLTLALCSEQPLHPSKDIDVDQFIDSHSAYNKYTVDQKDFHAVSLVYVTPWNKVGYDVAEIFTPKFDLISPVWFQILGRKKSYIVSGIPNVDSDWIRRLRHRKPTVKVVPRFIFEDWTAEDYSLTLKDSSKTKLCIDGILRVLNNYNLDGVVIEIWSQFSGVSDKDIIDFLKLLSRGLHDAKKLFVLVIPPPFYRGGFPGRFTKTHFDQLYNHVDYFSLMTYDYSSPMNPGPNSPIDWIRKCIEMLVPSNSQDLLTKRAKILTGMNFYGMVYEKGTYSGKPIIGHEFVDVIKQSRRPFQWDEESAEHFVEFSQPNGDESLVYYPTLLSISERLSLFSNMSTGVSIWEVGQGLHSFYSLF